MVLWDRKVGILLTPKLSIIGFLCIGVLGNKKGHAVKRDL